MFEPRGCREIRITYTKRAAAIYRPILRHQFAARPTSPASRQSKNASPCVSFMAAHGGSVPRPHVFACAAERRGRPLRAGAPIFCDARMVSGGSRGRAACEQRRCLHALRPSTPQLPRSLDEDAHGAAIELWLPRLGGSWSPSACADRFVSAPRTDLCRRVAVPPRSSACRSASSASGIEGGFDRARLARHPSCAGAKGGSAMAAAAVNALASESNERLWPP